jgi:hypothetical protein
VFDKIAKKSLAIRKLWGHSDPGMTNRYAHLSNAHLDNTAQRFQFWDYVSSLLICPEAVSRAGLDSITTFNSTRWQEPGWARLSAEPSTGTTCVLCTMTATMIVMMTTE